ncbi:hypothetical protein DXZ20_18055 [Leptolyngbyaceae cyanobacterium CCMR0081]|uniref:Uncharacterized protein n=1 Tax=Adonisia turfae CCMR0081 TaxID=2292702 RepID=A0A6M0RMY9_9CYAN|nr:hypothetical protein [Adonisia turfae CCMR0081]
MALVDQYLTAQSSTHEECESCQPPTSPPVQTTNRNRLLESAANRPSPTCDLAINSDRDGSDEQSASNGGA